MKRPRLVVFDFDGTLATLPVDWGGLKKVLTEYAQERLGVDGRQVPYFAGMQTLKEKLDKQSLEEIYRVVEEFEHRGIPHLIPHTAVVEYLRRSVERGSLAAVCSNNMTSTVRMSLGRLGIAPLVSEIVGMDSVTRLKPDPEGLSKILRTLKVTEAETVFVGDSSYDEQAAHEAGIRFVAAESVELQLPE
ncbi:MAG: HAD family hydrolase [Bacteroidota bacterium]